MSNFINVEFLQEQNTSSIQGGTVAQNFAALINSAQKSVHIAVYHFVFKDPKLKDPVIAALQSASKRGVDVKIAYYDEKSHKGMDVRSFGAISDPTGTANFLNDMAEGTNISLKAIKGSHLLHDKFVVVDGNTPDAKVQTGSTNFTDGAWKFMENNIIVTASKDLSTFFESVFDQLWTSGTILNTGGGTEQPLQIETAKVSAYFSPLDGKIIESTIGRVITDAKYRVKVSCMVLSSEVILQALVNSSRKDGVVFNGIYDEPETTSALKNSHTSSPELFKEIKSKLVGKKSKNYNPSAPDADYNYMHNKIVVSDDTVVTGSFNFSKNATMNAENILVIESKELADKFAEYIDVIMERYSEK